MHIIKQIQQAIWRLVRQVLLFLGFVAAAAVAPVVLAVIPQLLILHDPSGDFAALAEAFVWLTPLSVAFWMVVLCHWQSVRLWQREGRLSTWRQDHGGLVHTVGKSTGFMVLGLFGSFACEILFVMAFKYVPYEAFSGTSRLMLWFALFPFAAFLPVILLLLWRWRRSRKHELRAAFVCTKNLRSNQAPTTVSGPQTMTEFTEEPKTRGNSTDCIGAIESSLLICSKP